MRRLQQQFFMLGPPDWLKMKNAAAPAVKREEEEDWMLVASAKSSALGTNRTSRIWSNSHFRRKAFAVSY
jgi:hypothetical protein